MGVLRTFGEDQFVLLAPRCGVSGRELIVRHRPVAHDRSSRGGSRQARRLRQIAIGVVMLFAAEAALVSQDTGVAFATPTSGATVESAQSDAVKASGPAEAQDEASAVLMARLQDRKIEVLSARATDRRRMRCLA